MRNAILAKNLKVKGIVQGVGFRPYVYQLARKYLLKGDVANTSSGVSIHIEGPVEKIELFCIDLIKQKPPLSCITEISEENATVEGREMFLISESRSELSKSAFISPDMAVCEECTGELFDPSDRRFRYPFINCTNCGPRYTIISDLPYDRPNTSMKHFKMCSECQMEYEDPNNRRFHAQPNACERCGPQISLYEAGRKELQVKDAIKETARLLSDGFIVAIKGLGGFHLAVNAENNTAVIRLRERKHREEKPLALMSPSIEHIRKYAYVEDEEKRLLLSPSRPIVILKKSGHSPIAEAVSPRNGYLGAMLPYTPLHYLLLENNFIALVMTSGNLSEEPIVIDNQEALQRLTGIADYFLLHNRDIYLRSDDSVVKKIENHLRFIRRSRGYVPTPVFLKPKVPQILACGADLKNTVCLTKHNNAFLSQHIGDLENMAAYAFYKQTISHMKRILDIKPEIVAHDLHPGYISTRYAGEQSHCRIIPIQHHHAHIVSCMAENRIEGPVIGLSFDGTGYGTDGRIWGGEVFISDTKSFTRKAHLSYISMPGSDSAIKEPWRMAVSYLVDAFPGEVKHYDLPLFKHVEENKINLIKEMISKNINCPLTSSLGRLFDGVAAIMGLRYKVSFEGQAAMELENLAQEAPSSEKEKKIYDCEWTDQEVIQIPIQGIIRGVVMDMAKGVSPSTISHKFHKTLIHLFSKICETLRKESGLSRVAMSGGVFQNAILLSGLSSSLSAKGFDVFTHTQVPTNDGGISLGQAVAAAAIAES